MKKVGVPLTASVGAIDVSATRASPDSFTQVLAKRSTSSSSCCGVAD